MSRLMKSLNEAQRERLGDGQSSDNDTATKRSSMKSEPGYFWSSMALLVLVCSLIVGGFLLLRDVFFLMPH